MYNAWIQILVVSIFLSSLAGSAWSADLDVSELINGLRQAIVEAQKTATKPLINMPWVEAEISYTIKKEGTGGFKLYVVTADAKYAAETVQRFKFRLEPPSGKPWHVSVPGKYYGVLVSGVDPTARKLFVSEQGDLEAEAFPIYLTPDTKITDSTGKAKTISDIVEGMKGTIKYTPGPRGEPTAASIILEPPKKN